MREVDPAADDRGPGGHHLRRPHDRRPEGQRPGSSRPQPGHGVPELRALPAPHRLREHRVPAPAGQEGQRRGRQAGEERVGDPGARRAPRPQAGQPVRRPAAARRDGAGDRPPGRRVPLRRAAVQPRREAARPDAHRDLAAAEEARHHDGLRDPRPDRGDDARRPGRRPQARDPPAARHAAGALREPRQPLRRRLHRLAADELPALRGRRAPRRSCRSARSSCRQTKASEGRGQGSADRGHPARELRGRVAREQGRGRTGSTFQATVDVVEWLGNETYAYIPFEAPPEVEKQLQQLEQDLDGESLRTQLVVSLDGASTIKEGENAEIWLDASKIHLFDPSSGDNLTVDREHAGEIPEASARV